MKTWVGKDLLGDNNGSLTAARVELSDEESYGDENAC